MSQSFIDRLVSVVAPASMVYELGDTAVVLISVELWTRSIYFHVAAHSTDSTRQLDLEHQAVFAQWAAGPRDTAEPEAPGAEVLRRLNPHLMDDVGTAYTFAGSSAGGSGTEWRGQWQFRPGLPASATALSIAFALPDGSRKTERLEVSPRTA